MSECRVKATVSNDGTLTLKGIPFRAGDQVEVIMRSREPSPPDNQRYPLRGKPIRYDDPLTGVAKDDWEASR